MAALFLMLWTAVALVQDRRVYTTAPKDIQAAIAEHEERFLGARVIGWFLLLLCAVLFTGALVYGGWDGVQGGYSFWQFFRRFITMLYLEKAFDIIVFDWFLLTKIILFPFLSLLLAGICTLL